MYTIGQRVRVIKGIVDSRKLHWPYAGKNGVRAKSGDKGIVTGYTDYVGRDEQYPLVLFDNTDGVVQIRHNQVEPI